MALLPLIEADALLKGKYILMNVNQIPDLPLNGKEIRQVILNLVRNGLEAMEPGGQVTIRTYVEDEEVVLEVRDQGREYRQN